ncbi:MAG: YebC/PmpR family DNA-binding transcriptional regulator [Caulobacteraceae bacterium]
MAGHSKFKNIQFRKDRQDGIRSKLFSKLSRDITIAAKAGLPDPAANSRLRLAIANAKAESMPRDNIERAIKKAAGGEADAYEEIRYEGFGPGGVGLIVEALTDNRNRAAANVRAIFTKRGGAMGDTGSVAFQFERLGQIVYPLSAGDEDRIMEAAIEAGAEDVATDPDPEAGGHAIFTAFEDLGVVAETLETTLGPARSTTMIWKAKTEVPVDAEAAPNLIRMIEALEDEDDVQAVWTNAELPQEAG